MSREESKADIRGRRQALAAACILAVVGYVFLIWLVIFYLRQDNPELILICLLIGVLWTYTVRMYYKASGDDC